MDVEFRHVIAAALDVVERKLLSSAFVMRLAERARPVCEGELVELDDRGESVTRRARFVVAPSYRTGLLGGFGALAWVERVEWSRSTHQGTFEVVPELPRFIQRRMECGGVYRLEADGATSTVRIIRVHIVVRAPLVHHEIENSLRSFLRDLFDDEALVLGEASR